MIVYGDPTTDVRLRPFAAELRHHALAVEASGVDPSGGRLNALRTLLVRVGQLEQALHDADPEHPGLRPAQRATDRAASAFVADWRSVSAPSRADDADVLATVTDICECLDTVHRAPDVALRVKTPEGFAFYTLYPEQYCVAAERWCDDHAAAAAAAAGPILVVGVRSIGTSLSALVAAVLAGRGFDARRLTVRPTGHPFDRRATLGDSRALWSGATHALIVDEGPGISGSSMVAVARACEDEAGIPPDHIAFLPGHGGEPGHAASAAVREWWSRAPRYVTSLAELRWGDRTLTDLLAAATERLLGSPVSFVQDLSAGQWRPWVYPHECGFPAVCASFERAKYLVTTADGRSVFWKFAGLTGQAERDFTRLASLADKRWTPAPLACEHGFIATPWAPNLPATADPSPEPETLETLARYVLDAAGPPLPPAEQRQALDRLRDMLYWNTKESLGDATAELAIRWSDWMAARPKPQSAPRYGDGRLAPHEWIRAPGGKLIKTDCAGHDHDHTIVGPQPLVWDVAGALVEWQVESLPLPPDAPVDLAEVPFYRAAYAAYRLGQCALCASMLSPGVPDHIRLLEAAERYRADLEKTFASPPPQ